MKTNSTIFLLLVVLTLSRQASPVFGIPDECKKPGEQPVHLIDWQWSAGSPGWYRLAFQDEYVFVSDMFNQRVIRYPINGGQPENWAIIPGTLQSNPSDVHINPVTGDLYVAGFSTDPRVLVFDPAGTGTPKDTLFTDSPGPDHGDMVGSGFPIAIHPVTGDLYVVDEDTITVGQQIVWISRIQRFKSDGTYDNFVIENTLEYNPIEDDNEPPVAPACGAWHYPRRMWIDADGNIYLREFVDALGTMQYLHKFDSTGTCTENWDSGQRGIEIDTEGYVYTYSDSLYKLSPDRTDTLYVTAALSNDIEQADIKAGGSEFFALASYDALLQTLNMEIKGPEPKTVNFLGTDWQDPDNNFEPWADSLRVLLDCDSTHAQMSGVVADGVSPLLLRWYLPGPGEVAWILEDPTRPTEESLLGTLSSLDGLQVDTTTITTDVELVGGDYVAFAVYAAPLDFDRLGVPLDGLEATRPLRITTKYFPDVASTPELTTDVSLDIHRPPVMFVHGLWSKSTVWSEFSKIRKDDHNRWRVEPVDYSGSHGSALAENQLWVPGWVRDTKGKIS